MLLFSQKLYQFKIENFAKFREQKEPKTPERYFDFFYQNQHLFRKIEQDDYMQIKALESSKIKFTINTLYGLAFGTLVLEKWLFKSFNFNPITPGGKAFNLVKYFVFPIATAGVVYKHKNDQIVDLICALLPKYSLGTVDYHEAMNQVERAYNAGRLMEFYQSGYEFDLKGNKQK